MTTIKSLRKAISTGEISAPLIATIISDKISAQALVDNQDIDLKLSRFPRVSIPQAEAIIAWADSKISGLKIPADLVKSLENFLRPEIDAEVTKFKADIEFQKLLKSSDSDVIEISADSDSPDFD